jgi:hypothetical protein
VGRTVPAEGGARRTRQTAGKGVGVSTDDLLAYIAAHPGSRGEAIAAALGTNSISMRPRMRKLEAGKVKTRGERRGRAYWPA